MPFSIHILHFFSNTLSACLLQNLTLSSYLFQHLVHLTSLILYLRIYSNTCLIFICFPTPCLLAFPNVLSHIFSNTLSSCLLRSSCFIQHLVWMSSPVPNLHIFQTPCHLTCSNTLSSLLFPTCSLNVLSSTQSSYLFQHHVWIPSPVPNLWTFFKRLVCLPFPIPYLHIFFPIPCMYAFLSTQSSYLLQHLVCLFFSDTYSHIFSNTMYGCLLKFPSSYLSNT